MNSSIVEDELREYLAETIQTPPGSSGPDQTASTVDRSRQRSTPPKKRLHPLIRGSEARIIRTGRHTGYVGDVPITRLNGKLASGESMLELDFLIVTDAYEDDFLDIVSQPFTVLIDVNGRPRKWTPDYLMNRTAGYDELCEVKMLSWLYHKDPAKRALAQVRNAAMERAAHALNFKYRLLTEDQIRVQPRLTNAKLVHRHCGPHFPKEGMVAALSALHQLSDTTSITKLTEALAPRWKRHALALAIRLERAGHIRIDRRTRYSRKSTFWKMNATQMQVTI